MSLGTVTGEDCNYINAVDILLSVGETMQQPTPPAVIIPTGTESHYDTSSDDDDSDGDSKCDTPSPRRAECGTPTPKRTKKRPREESDADTPDFSSRADCSPATNTDASANESQTPSPKRSKYKHLTTSSSCKDIWLNLQEREESATYRIVPNYPDTRWCLNKIPPGSRRKAVNIIYLMAYRLNLEVGTPSMAVLLFDRFMSAIRVPVSSNKILFIAAVCLNIAGKIFDIDNGFCGSKGVMQMIRDMVPPCIRQRSEKAFAVSMGDMECYIMQCMNNKMMELPNALQCISEVTQWDRSNYMAWLHSALLCDIISADTASTNFCQYQIAKAVIENICDIESRSFASKAIARAQTMFIASSEEHIYRDPYFGIRMRHNMNPCISIIDP